jgi:hypothetical protein
VATAASLPIGILIAFARPRPVPGRGLPNALVLVPRAAARRHRVCVSSDIRPERADRRFLAEHLGIGFAFAGPARLWLPPSWLFR